MLLTEAKRSDEKEDQKDKGSQVPEREKKMIEMQM